MAWIHTRWQCRCGSRIQVRGQDWLAAVCEPGMPCVSSLGVGWQADASCTWWVQTATLTACCEKLNMTELQRLEGAEGCKC